MKSIDIIVSKMKPKKEDSMEMGPAMEDMDMEEGLMASSEEILKAMEAKDSNALKDALKEFVAQCKEDYSQEGME